MKVAIIGTAGIPASYGGFETLAENLVRVALDDPSNDLSMTVFCSSRGLAAQPESYLGARLLYSNFSANGVSSIPYDVVTALRAARDKHDVILFLGVSGAILIPFLRIFSKCRLITNIDGVEWKREKWGMLAKMVLRISEWIAVYSSHEIIADNEGIAKHVRGAYGIESAVIAYGGDHALNYEEVVDLPADLPKHFALALCRIEPENNVHVILDAFDRAHTPLVFVGNWGSSAYGKSLRNQFGKNKNIYLLDPIYEPNMLFALRSSANFYIHGHSAGGTNPSLVEMMHFGIPIIAYDCEFNRYTTEGSALFFKSSTQLNKLMCGLSSEGASQVGQNMREIAERKYTWEKVGKEYLKLFQRI